MGRLSKCCCVLRLRRSDRLTPIVAAIIASTLATTSTIGLMAAVTATVSAASGPSKSITYMAYLSPQQAQALKKLTDAFRKQTGIEVKLLNTPWDQVWTKMKLMIAAGTPPDVYGGGVYAYDIAAIGALVDLTSYLQRDHLSLSNFFAAGVAAPRYGSVQYGLPYGINTTLLAYNVDMVEAAGLLPPGTWDDKSWWTWDKYAEYAKKMTRDTNGDGSPDIFGGVAWPQGTLDVPWMFGTGWLSPDLKHTIIDSPGAIRSFMFVRKMIYEMKAAPTPDQFGAFGYGISTGKIAMGSIGTWSVNDYSTSIKSFKWNVAAIPIGTDLPPGGGYAMPAYPDGFILFKGGNVEAAWQWVKFVLFNEDNLRYFAANVVGQIPATLPAARWYMENLRQKAPYLDIATVLQAPEHAQIQRLFFTTRTHDIQSIADQGIWKIFAPDADVVGEAKTLAAKIQQMLD